MQIGGLTRLSLIDYPGKIAAVVFTQGCNFRCSYCHNMKLVIPACFEETIPEAEVISFFTKRKGLLEGVVISGGEPTLQNDLPQFLAKLKALGFSVKLDTNGSRPDVLKTLMIDKLLDYVAMDIKAPLERYCGVIGAEIETDLIKRSIDLVKMSGVDHQFRTTVCKPLVDINDLKEISKIVEGAQSYILQNFVSCGDLVDPLVAQGPLISEAEFAHLKKVYEFAA